MEKLKSLEKFRRFEHLVAITLLKKERNTFYQVSKSWPGNKKQDNERIKKL